MDAENARFDWPYVWGIVREHRSTLVAANLVAALAALTRVPLPLLFPLLVDEVLLERPGSWVSAVDRFTPDSWRGPVLYISAALVATLLLRLFGLALNVAQTREFSRISKEIVHRIRVRLLSRLQRISMAEYETLGSGAVSSRLLADVATVDSFVGPAVSNFMVNVLTLLGVAAVLLWMNWRLALLILLLNPVVGYATVRLGRWVKDLKRRENRAIEEFQDSLNETLESIHELRASNREAHYLGRLTQAARRVRDHAVAFAWKSDTANNLSFSVFLFGFDLFRALSMLAVVYSGLTLGQMLAVFSYLWLMMGPVQDLLRIQYAYFAADGALGRLDQLLELREEPCWPRSKDPFEGRRGVEVELCEVSCAYGDGPRILTDVSLRIAAGEKVAVVGASGGGKSTLMQVFLGLYPPNRGSITYGGVDVRQIGLDRVRENVAAVLQQPALFNDSVRANLTLGRQRLDEEIWQSLEVVQLRKVVESLGQGLETQIGRHGVRLSGGQRQRLAIARMMLADPKVVILDEATSALDTDTERRLHTGLAEFLAGRTTLIIAHRLSALRLADRVLVFEAGRLSEQGTPVELLAQDGLYTRLYGRGHRLVGSG